jgi:uncharacterized iron-regulated membrane protein
MAERRITIPNVDFVDHRKAVTGDIVAAWIVVLLLIGAAGISFTLDQLVTVTAAPQETFAAAVAEVAARQEAAALEDPLAAMSPSADDGAPVDDSGADEHREMIDVDWR